MATIDEYLTHIYTNVLEPSQVTALREHLSLESPGSVRVHQVAAALKVINAPGVAMSILRSFCEKHKIPIDWLGKLLLNFRNVHLLHQV